MVFTISSKRAKSLIMGTAVLASVALMLSGCSRADAGSGGGEQGEGLPAGSSKADYQAALADMEPTRLIMQSSAASPTIPSAQPWINLAETVNEWSNGNIEVEITWNNGIVPVTDVDKALVDGRIDLATFHALYKPQEYPATDMLYNAAITRDASAVIGDSAIQGALSTVGGLTPEVMAEFEDQGLTVLNPIFGIGPAGMVCKEPLHDLSDFAGKQLRVSGLVHTTQAEALGGTPVSMTYPEVYEALQRGIIDCAAGQIGSFTSTGWVEVAPHVIMSDATALATTPGTFLGGTNFKKLPLAAQQLIFDQVGVYTAASVQNGFEDVLPTLHAAIESFNGSFTDMGKDASDALVKANQGILDAMHDSTVFDGEKFTKAIADENERWLGLVDEAGYTEGGSNADFTTWYKPGSFDPAPLADLIQTEALNQFRPGN